MKALYIGNDARFAGAMLARMAQVEMDVAQFIACGLPPSTALDLRERSSTEEADAQRIRFNDAQIIGAHGALVAARHFRAIRLVELAQAVSWARTIC